jgi:rare lipoprotein A
VTNLKTGKQVIVRINDRGPFHSSRIIDLSYTAALKLGYLGTGSSELEVERILPEEAQRMADARRNGGGTTLAAADPINRAADTGAGGQGVSTGQVEINTVSAQSLPPQPTVAAVQPINASTSTAAGGAAWPGAAASSMPWPAARHPLRPCRRRCR